MSAIETVREKLKRHPDLRYDEAPGSIIVQPTTPDGFPVALYQHGDRITVSFAGWHEEFTSEAEALNCFGFGLSEWCRLRVTSRGSTDYRWTVQHYREGVWHAESETGLLFFPFWKRRRERYLQNHAIEMV